MKTVYVVYDGYERDEFYGIYFVSTRLNRKKWRECVKDFLGFKPDDGHSLFISRIALEDDEYDQLMKFYTEKTDFYDEELINFMSNHIYGNKREERLYLFKGYDIYEMGQFYLEDTNQDPDNEDEVDSIVQKLCKDKDFYDVVLDKWLKDII